jgi:hypothetical protein
LNVVRVILGAGTAEAMLIVPITPIDEAEPGVTGTDGEIGVLV